MLKILKEKLLRGFHLKSRQCRDQGLLIAVQTCQDLSKVSTLLRGRVSTALGPSKDWHGHGHQRITNPNLTYPNQIILNMPDLLMASSE